MSYYLGVWEGPAPLSNTHAGSEFERRMATRSQDPPSPLIRQFIAALLEAHPDIDRPDGEGGPWSDGPLLNYVDGSAVFVPVRPERVDEVSPLVERRAQQLQLIAFDPQRGQLLPSAVMVARTTQFEMPSRDELPVHLRAVMVEAMSAGRPMAGIVEQLDTEFYVQWLTRDGDLTIEAQGDQALRLTPDGRAQMSDLGFAEADPNWNLQWVQGPEHLDEAAILLARVLTDVRRLPVGAAMSLQTFPV